MPKAKKQVSAPRKPADRSVIPIVGELTEEEVQATISQPVYHSALNKELDRIEVGRGLRLQGSLNRIRAAINGFNSKSGKKFIARSDGDDHARVVRVS
jgi:hypothetical protein